MNAHLELVQDEGVAGDDERIGGGPGSGPGLVLRLGEELSIPFNVDRSMVGNEM